MENTKVSPVYANRVSTSNSLFEVRLEFFIESPSSEGEAGNIERVADVRVSPQLAKQLKDVLSQCIDNYERGSGAIPTGGIAIQEG